MNENLTQLIVGNPSDVGGIAAQVGKVGNRIGDRPAGHLGGRSHHLVNFVRPSFVDQRHRSPWCPDAVKQVVIDMGQHVHNGIADAE